VAADTPQDILSATRELLACMAESNGLQPDDLVSILLSATTDLISVFPAEAARQLQWTDVPLLCMTEIPVPGALPRCIRVLMHVECALPREEIAHIYLRGAEVLRPDLSPAAETRRHGAEAAALEAAAPDGV
jgi:chorismate mutase